MNSNVLVLSVLLKGAKERVVFHPVPGWTHPVAYTWSVHLMGSATAPSSPFLASRPHAMTTQKCQANFPHTQPAAYKVRGAMSTALDNGMLTVLGVWAVLDEPRVQLGPIARLQPDIFVLHSVPLRRERVLPAPQDRIRQRSHFTTA